MNLISIKEGGPEVAVPQFSDAEAAILQEAAALDKYAQEAFLRQHFDPEWIGEAVRATEALGRPNAPVQLEGGRTIVRDFYY